MLTKQLERCALWLVGDLTLKDGECQPDIPKLLMTASKKINKLKNELEKSKAQTRIAYGYGSDLGMPPWME